MIDLSRVRLKPFAHQLKGIEALVNWDDKAVGRIIGGVFFLGDEMGVGKTKQVIDACQVLAERELIKRVVIVAPAAVRGVWFDPELGELSKHLWGNFACVIREYHSQIRKWEWFMTVDGKQYPQQLEWIITNYDFIRNPERLKPLLKYADDDTFLVCDESSAIKNYRAKQTKAVKEIRSRCGRVVELNGTPIANHIGDLYSQAEVMDPRILGCKTYFHFRARYAKMGGWQGKQIIGWHDIDDIQRRMAPYVLRRLKEQCSDLPAKLDSVIIEKPLTPATWKMYKEMRDDMVAWLNEDTVSTASQAIVKAIRLAQITSGFIGGIEAQERIDVDLFEDIPDFMQDGEPEIGAISQELTLHPLITQEVGREKLEAFLDWLDGQLDADPQIKILVWCRFRPEVQRLYEELKKTYPQMALGKIWGGQKRAEREAAIRLLDPRTAVIAPTVVIGTPATGSMGLNLTAAHTVVYMSNDFSLKTRLQSEDRVHRPGQIHAVSYYDMIATGPQGQKTIDHHIFKALRNKEDLADLTTSAWLDILTEV